MNHSGKKKNKSLQPARGKDASTSENSTSRAKRTIPNSQSGAEIKIEDLTVTAGDRVLLDGANATLDAGKITLIVGPSGVGKSVLLRIIAGLIDHSHNAIHYSGDVKIGDAGKRIGELGVVFQSFALFDELSPKANVKFAKDHGGARSKDVVIAEMLKELNVPTNVPTSQLSGGQRQRLAIARTLAFNPPAILYDEPTSGLDPSTGAQVAELIKSTHKKFQKTSIIVTHDYETLLPIADQVYVLDPVEKSLELVPRKSWPELPSMMNPLAAAAIKQDEPQKVDWTSNLAKRVSAFFRGTTSVVEAFIVGIISIIPTWRNVGWGCRHLAHYLRLVVGPTAWFYLAMAGFIVGFVTTYFVFRFLPYATYIEPLLIDDLLGAMGFSLYRIFVPVLATVLIAARCGAAVTSDVGSKQYGNQIDALRSLGASPRSYLLTPIMIAFVVGTPLLTMIGFFTSKWVSLISFVAAHREHGPDFWNVHFHHALRFPDRFFYEGAEFLYPKLICCGIGVAIISYNCGRSPKYSSNDVSQSVTSSIFWSTLFVLVVHFCFAFFEFKIKA